MSYNFLNQQIYMSDAMALDRLAVQAARPGMRVIELGSFTGRSSLAMLPTIKQHDGRLTCVDWFKGNEGLGEQVGLSQGYATSNVLEIFRNNLRVGGFEEHVDVVVGKTQDVAPAIQDGCADLVFVDADHRYTGVRQDIIDWYPKLKEGGILCGHDFERPMAACDPEEVMRHCETDYVDGHHYGVIRAVSEFFPVVQQQGVVWWVIKKEGAFPELEAAIAASKDAAGKGQHSIGPAPTSHPVLDEFLDHQPVNSLLNEARMVWAAGDVVNAMRAAKALNRRAPQDVGGWCLAYEVLDTLQEEEEAQRHLNLAFRAVGMNSELMAFLGARKHREGQHDQAVEAFQASLLPQMNGLLNLGYAQMGASNFNEALVCFQMAAQLNPSDPEALLGLAESHLRLGHREALATLLEQLTHLVPDSTVLAALREEAGALQTAST